MPTSSILHLINGWRYEIALFPSRYRVHHPSHFFHRLGLSSQSGQPFPGRSVFFGEQLLLPRSHSSRHRRLGRRKSLRMCGSGFCLKKPGSRIHHLTQLKNNSNCYSSSSNSSNKNSSNLQRGHQLHNDSITMFIMLYIFLCGVLR